MYVRLADYYLVIDYFSLFPKGLQCKINIINHILGVPHLIKLQSFVNVNVNFKLSSISNTKGRV